MRAGLRRDRLGRGAGAGAIMREVVMGRRLGGVLGSCGGSSDRGRPGDSDGVLAGVVCSLPDVPFGVVHGPEERPALLKGGLEDVEDGDGAEVARRGELLKRPVLEHHTVFEGDALLEAHVPDPCDRPTQCARSAYEAVRGNLE